MARDVQIPYLRSNVVTGRLNSRNLERAVKAALTSNPGGRQLGQDASLRKSEAAGEYGTLVLNQYELMNPGVFVEVVRFAPGSQIPLIETRQIGQRFNLRNANTPDGHDLIRGYAYAMFIGDHVLSLSRDFAPAKFELYFEDFLGPIARHSSGDLKLRFIPEINIDGLPQVDEVVFRPRNSVPVRTEARDARSVGPSRITAGPIAWDVLKAACFTEPVLERLQSQGVEFDVKLEVVFKHGRSRHEVERADISELLRDLPEEGIVLKSSIGNERKGTIRRISHTAQVETVGDLFDARSAAAALFDAYRHFKRNGFIT